MKSNNKISIVLPTYNGADYIRQSIKSCLKQTHKNIELIVVDDCSTDKTFEILSSFKDDRIKIIRNNKNMGVAFSLNKGFTISGGDFLTWTSDDNYYQKDALERMLYCLKNSDAALVYSNYYILLDKNFNDNKSEASLTLKSFPDINQIKNTCIVGPCFLYRREAANVVGGYDCELSMGADYDYWLRIYQKFQITHFDETLYYYRAHSKSLTGSNITGYGIYIETILIWLRYGTVSVETAFYKLINYIIEIIRTKREQSGRKENTEKDYITDYILDNKILFNEENLKGIKPVLNDFFLNIRGFKDTKKYLLKLIESRESILQKITSFKDIFKDMEGLLDTKQYSLMVKEAGKYFLKNKNTAGFSELSSLSGKNRIFIDNLTTAPTLAVCMIVKNEESNLAACLESIIPVAKELVIVDTGSEDNTCRIAKSYGAKIKKYAWNENFSEARNYSIKDIKSDWILFLDADEVLEKESIAFLKSLVSCNNPKAYYVKFLNMQSGMEEIVLTEHYNLRLFNNNAGFKFSGALHEQLLLESGAEYEKAVSPVVLRHYGYGKNYVAARNKAERNSVILLKALESEPDSAFNCYNMGVNLHIEEKYRQAIDYFDKAVKLLDKKGSFANYLPFCFSYKSSCHCSLGDYEKAIGEAEKALEQSPGFKVAYFNLANAFYFKGDYKKAAINYRNAIEAEDNIMLGGSYDKSVGSWKSYNGLGLTYLKICDYEKAREYLEKAYMLQSKSEMIIINLAVLYKLTSNIAKLDDLLNDIKDVFFSVKVSQQLSDILLHFGRHESAIRVLNNILELYVSNKIESDETGLNVNLLCCNIADIYFALNQYEKAVPYYEKACQADKNSEKNIGSLGLCHLRLKHYGTAAVYFSNAIDHNNQEPSYFSNLGNCLSEMGCLEDSRMAYDCALLLKPDYLPALIGIEAVEISRSLKIRNSNLV